MSFTRVTETHRIIPPLLGSAAGLAISLPLLAMIAWFGLRPGAPLYHWPFVLIGVLLAILGALSFTQLLPGSPTDYLEIGPSGLTIGGLIGRRHRRWEDIQDFSVSMFPTRGSPLVQVKAVSRRQGVSNMRFSMGGYMKLGWFDEISDVQRDLADWFANVKAAYTGGNHSGLLPSLPRRFVGRLIVPLGGF